MTHPRERIKSTNRDTRINIRAPQHKRDLIDCAAKILGKSRSDFMLEVACQKAEDTLLEQKHFFLNQENWQDFLNALDEPPKNNPKLRKLLNKAAPWEITE